MIARRLVAAVLSGLLVLAAPPSRAARRKPAPALAGRSIASITVVAYNVFDTSVYPESKLLYRMANAFHRTTREAVVRRELLFAVGQPYDATLVAESERNLRLLPILRRAAIESAVNARGTVDVVVRTYDAWSLEVVAHYKRAGGTTEWKGGLTEHNLLGSGNSISAEYKQDGGTPSRSIDWKDTQFLGRQHQSLALSAASGPDTRSYSFAVNRPFYASITRASSGLNGSYAENRASTYEGDALTGTALRRASEVGVVYGVALATSTARTRRVSAGLMNHHVDFLPLPATAPGTLPEREQFVFLQLAADWQELDFVKVRRVQKLSHDEDYNLGLSVLPTVSWAPRFRPLEGAESQVLPGLTVRKGFAWEDRLLLLRASYTTGFVNGANSNRVAAGDALFFLTGLPRQTLALHAAYDHGWRLDPASRLKLGESNGLRGYGLEQFSGERRLLLNIEDRVFLYEELLRVLDIGAVVFYDSGWAWDAKTHTQLTDLHHSVGLGLRLAASRSAGNSPVRIDLARALSPNGTNSRWTLSVIGGHAFGPE
ncbi:MAG: hypothetical protein PHS14_09240 [Elusimicrobia bacterium]|nr:hypothetical protein [Elusimicrobiota bacterium]